MVSHPAERQPLVLKLGTFVTGFAPSAGGTVDDPHTGVALVLVLATVAASPESLHLAVLQGDGEQKLSIGHWSRVAFYSRGQRPAGRCDDMIMFPFGIPRPCQAMPCCFLLLTYPADSNRTLKLRNPNGIIPLSWHQAT